MMSVCHEQHPNQDSLHPCTPEDQYMASPSGHVPSCVRLETSLFPKNVWDTQDKVSTLVKLVAYGMMLKIMTVCRSDLQPRHNALAMYRIPRQAHYLCTNDCKLSFGVYLSILRCYTPYQRVIFTNSAVYVAGLHKVLIHGPQPPSGFWWDRLQTVMAGRILHLHREFNYPGNVTSDMQRYIMRTEILFHYGGVYHDNHVLCTQPLPEELLQYEAVASPDWHAHSSWPESVNHALLIARGGATYLQQLLQMYKENINSESPWVAEHYLSYRLIELDPTLVFLYPHLQVKCLNHNCHPTWQHGYRSYFIVNRPGNAFDWRTETLSVHWVDSFPDLDVDQIKFTSGLIVDIAQHVLAIAGVDVNRL